MPRLHLVSQDVAVVEGGRGDRVAAGQLARIEVHTQPVVAQGGITLIGCLIEPGPEPLESA